ncbi:MAG TPA: DUF4838 domain-containing protein, partial [Nitrococcus sp.]|nr:DUF4838 domain-containing protein [Nitrococcus sp.]
PTQPATAANLTLARDGHTAYRIVTPARESTLAGHAADELASYLQRVTGAHFAVATEAAGGPAIRLATDSSGELAREGFRILSHGQDIRITGGSPRGLLYGVYAFLEDYAGVHWYGPDATEIPRRPTFTVPAIDRTEAPAFAYREVFVAEADAPQYSAANRLNGRFGHRLVRAMGQYPDAFVPLRDLSIFDLVPPKSYSASHPEYYSGGQLRFADPDVRRIALATLRKNLAQWSRSGDEPYYLLIDHADRDTYYDGGADGALIKRYDSPGAAYIDFVKYLAEQVAGEYPHVTLLPLAYQWSRKPPHGMQLPPNMGVMFSDIERDFARPLQASDNRGVLADLEGWGKLTDHILLWTYITDFNGYLQPFPDLHALEEDIPFLAQQRTVAGVFAQGAYNTTGGEFSVLRTWLLAHLLWNPRQDPQRLVQTFLHGYYGAAAPQIADYIRLLHESVERTGSRLSDKTPPTAGYLTTPLLQQADRLFQQAEHAVANDPDRLRHVRIARASVDYAILASQPGSSGWVDRAARLKRLQASLKLAGMQAYREGSGASLQRLAETLAIARHQAPPPAVCRGLPAKDCRSVQELSLDLAGDARIIADQAASDGAAVTMSGGSGVWGIQLPLDRLLPDGGRWQIYVAARVAAASTTGALLQVGVYPGMRHSVYASELPGNGYHLIKVPGLWQHDPGRIVWVAPPGSKSVQAIYIDRIVAVRAGGS